MVRAIIKIFIFIGLLSGCTVQKDKDDLSFLGKLYHNTTAKYNGYYNADLLMQESKAILTEEYVEDYDTLIPVYPYMANKDVDHQYNTLDKIIEKVTTVSALHRQSHWLDDNYLMLGKAYFLKKDYKEANAAFQYLVNNFDPVNPNEAAREVKETRARSKASKATYRQQQKEQKKRRKEINKRRKEAQKAAKKARKKGKKQRPARNENPETTEREKDEPLLASADPAPTPSSSQGFLSPHSNPENYVMKHSPVYQDGLLWEARTWVAQENYFSAEARLNSLINDPNAAERIKNEAYIALIDSYVKSEKYPQALQTIDIVLDRKISKDQKVRLAFLAGQIALKTNQSVKSVAYFDQVRKLNPSYEKNFYAQLFSAKAEGGDLIGKFQDLLKNPNNAKYEGQIYYVMGEVYRDNYDFRHAIDAFKKTADPSLEASSTLQGRALLAIADIYFDQNEYRNAKSNYDKSLSFLSDSSPEYKRANERAKMLTKIANAEEIIHLQDSLLTISDFSDEQKRELALKLKKENESMSGKENEGSPGQATSLSGLRPSHQGSSAGSTQSSFFAYNEKTVKDGLRDFERKWGERSLEDNWRYGGSGSVRMTEDDADSAAGSSLSFGITQTEIDEILQDVPTTPEEIELVNAKINHAMLDKGFSLRSDLDQIDRSNEELIRLLERKPDIEIAAEATYLLYLNALEAGDNTKANQYKTQFDQQFNRTEFYEKIRSSASFASQDDVAQSALDQIEKTYKDGDYEEVLKLTERSSNLFKDKKSLLPQFAMFEALATGKIKGRDPYIEKLQNLIASFPESLEATKARDYLQVLGADVKTDITASSSSGDDEEGFNTQVENTPHYILVTIHSSDDINPLKAAISDFNKEFFQNKNMTISTVQIATSDGRDPALLVRRFNNKEDAMHYYEVARKNPEIFSNNIEIEILPLAISNYRFLITENKIDSYREYLNKVYGITL